MACKLRRHARQSLVALIASLAAISHGGPAFGSPTPVLSKLTQEFVRVQSARIVLTHVAIIDGTGAPAVADRNVEIANGTIVAITAGADHLAAPGEAVLDLRGHTVMPGIVGMHDHLFYIARPNLRSNFHSEAPLLIPQMSFSAPRLYLAAGVTTLRTAGSVDPNGDLGLKEMIDRGEIPGPGIRVTGPYLEGQGSSFIQMRPLKDAKDARETVRYWAERGVSSFKAYMNITRDELAAAIDEAHRRGLKVTGHLCSITYPEAAALGIDNLEHGFLVNTQLDPDKQSDRCTQSQGEATMTAMNPDGPAAKALINLLVSHHVALTSTLAVFESMGAPARPPLREAAMDAMSVEARLDYLYQREPLAPSATAPAFDEPALFARELRLERAFVAAGGLLMAGSDPTGDGGVLPGFGDQRGIELLVEAGFTPVEAIEIATLNGARFLGEDQDIGSIAVGKHADLVVVRGDPSQRITDVENVELVFHNGVGFDSAKLLESVRGRYGQY